MANSIKFMNEGFNKYNNIKPSFEDSLYEAMKSLTERQQEWSDEDKHDNELLWSIMNKRSERNNAALTPEEKSVMAKYNITGTERFYPQDMYSVGVRMQDGDVLNPFSNNKDRTYRDKKVNAADKLRKVPERRAATSGVGAYDKRYRDNMDDMNQALWDRKYYTKKLAGMDAESADRIAKLQGQIEDEKRNLEMRKSSKQKALNITNNEIDTLLNRKTNEAYSEEQVRAWKNDFGKLTSTLSSMYYELNTDEAKYFVRELYGKTLEKAKSLINQK